MVRDYFGNRIKYSEDDIIEERNRLIKEGAKAKEIDDALTQLSGGVSYNYNPFNVYNVKNLIPNIVRNAGDFAKDIRTFGGSVLNSLGKTGADIYQATSPMVVDETSAIAKSNIMDAFKRAVSLDTLKRLGKDAAGIAIGAGVGALAPNKLGPISGGITGGIAADIGPKATIDAMLSPYNVSIEDIKSGNVDWRDPIQGMFTNPLYVGTDVLASGGAKGMSKLANTEIPWLSEIKRKSSILSEAVEKPRADLTKKYAGINALSTMPNTNRENIVKAIVYSDYSNLSKDERKVAYRIKKDLDEAQKVAIENKFIPEQEAINNVIAQYATMKNANKYKDLEHASVVQYLEGKKVKLPEDVIQDIDKAKKLYDKGRIKYLSQMMYSTPSSGVSKLIEDIPQGTDYWSTKRISGRTQPKELATVLDKTIRSQLDQVYKPLEADSTIRTFVNEVGKSYKKGYELKPDEVIIRKGDIQEAVDKIYKQGNLNSIRNMGYRKGKVGDIVVKRSDLDALYNALTPNRQGPFGRILANTKKMLLANPHWVEQNRIGNWSNNIIEGVTRNDYVDAFNNIDMMPKQLKAQTAYNAYLGSVLGENTNPLKKDVVKTPFRKATNKIIRGWKEGDKLSNKNWADIYEGLNEYVSSNIFSWESNFEAQDRYANMIRQAKRMAGDNQDWKDIIKRASEDDKLYRRLNLRVNKSLGDYVGRWYYMNPKVYTYTRELYPFYRFLTQTGRTTWNQLKNRPLAFQGIVGLPTKAGNITRENIEKEYGIGEENNYRGGVPYYLQDNDFRVIGTEPLPFHSAMDIASNILQGDFSGIMNPLISGYTEASTMSSNGRPTVTQGLVDAKTIGEGREYEYTPSERYSVLANKILDLELYPYRSSKGWWRDLIYLLSGMPEQSLTNELGFMINPTSYPKTEPYEKIGKYFGIQTSPAFLPRGKSINELKRERRSGGRYSARIEQRREQSNENKYSDISKQITKLFRKDK